MPDLMYLYCLDFPNGKKYIGITLNPKRRLAEHHEPKSRCTYIRTAIKKYGSPKFSILCIGLPDYILELEIKAIAAFQTQDRNFGYNISAGGDTSPALVKEVAEKIRITLTGRMPSPEACAKNSAANKGRPKSHEHRAKIGASNKGRIISPEQRTKISATLIERWAATTHEERAKIFKGPSLETRAKMSAALIKRWATTTPEDRAKMSKPPSPEHRAKISAAGLKRQAAIRAHSAASVID